ALLAASRPVGAADPEREPAPDERWAAPPAPTTAETAIAPLGGVVALLQRATEAEQKGNAVRAAILRTQAAGAASGPAGARRIRRCRVRRNLPHARPVMMLMAFCKAHKQLRRAGLGEPEQLRLDRLMHHEIHRQEHAIRHAFTPIVVAEITAAGLVPVTRVEE